MIRPPSRCVMELGYKCNLTCCTCNIWKPEFYHHRGKGDMALSATINIQAQLTQAGIGQITYLGGEPLLYPDIFALIASADKNRITTAIVTNGLLLNTQAIHRSLNSGLNTIILSLDGPESIHDTIRGKKGLFKKVKHNITSLQKMKRKGHLRIPKICIYTTISKINAPYLFDMFAIAQKLDVQALRFQLMSVVDKRVKEKTNKIFKQNVVGFHSYAVDSELKPDLKQRPSINELTSFAGNWSRRTGIQVQFEERLAGAGSNQPCQFIQKNVVINPFGDILPCPMLVNLSIGNIRENTFQTIWGGEKHRRFLDTIHHHRFLPVCAECCVEKPWDSTST